MSIAWFEHGCCTGHTPQMSGGRIITGFVRGIGTEYFASGVNPTFSHERYYEAHELILRAWTETGPFRYHGKPLLGFAAAKGHLSLYPFSPQVLEAVAPQLDGYKRSKGTLRFTADRPLPAQVVTEIVQRRMAEIDGT